MASTATGGVTTAVTAAAAPSTVTVSAAPTGCVRSLTSGRGAGMGRRAACRAAPKGDRTSSSGTSASRNSGAASRPSPRTSGTARNDPVGVAAAELSRAEQGDAVQARLAEIAVVGQLDRAVRALRERHGVAASRRRVRDGVPLDESGGEDVGAGAAGGPMLRTVHERVLRPRHVATAGCGGRASALVLWGRPGELPAGGERGAGCERTGRLSRRPASTTVTGP